MALHIGALHMSAKIGERTEHSYDYLIGEKEAIERDAKNHRMKELVANEPLPTRIAKEIARFKHAKIPSVNYWQEGETLYRNQYPRGIEEAKKYSKGLEHVVDLLASRHAMEEHGATHMAIKYDSPKGKRARFLEKPKAIPTLHKEFEAKLRKR